MKVDTKKLDGFLQHKWPCPWNEHPKGWEPEGGMWYEGPGYRLLECTCGLNKLLGKPVKLRKEDM